MPISLDAIAAAIAARYDASQMTAPSGLDPIRQATHDLPEGIAVTPVVLVFPDEGAFPINANGTRQGFQDWPVRFYLDKATDSPRQLNRLRQWADVLLYQHLAEAQLGGLVVICELQTWSMGDMDYAGITYAGIELVVHTVTSEPWSPTA